MSLTEKMMLVEGRTVLDMYGEVVNNINNLGCDVDIGKYDVPQKVWDMSREFPVVGGVKQIINQKGMEIARRQIRYLFAIVDIEVKMDQLPETLFRLVERQLKWVELRYHARGRLGLAV